jgi:hypothetical protein
MHDFFQTMQGCDAKDHHSREAHSTNQLRNFISVYHQAYRAAVWSSRHDLLEA